jgi:hypothetical protein
MESLASVSEILHKRLGLGLNIYSMSQILNLTLFNITPVLQVALQVNSKTEFVPVCVQLDLLNI